MSARVVIAVNLANYPEGALRDRQNYAWGVAEKLHHPEVKFIPLFLRCEWEGQYETDNRMLSRCACQIGGKRHLPYIREMIMLAYREEPGAHYVGYMNSDIIITPALRGLVRGMLRGRVSIVMVQRSEVSKPEEVPVPKGLVEKGADLLLIRSTELKHFLESYPDFLAGEPRWDTGLILWAKKHDVSVSVHRGLEIKHVMHRGEWAGKRGLRVARLTPSGKHNVALHDSLLDETARHRRYNRRING